MVIFPLHRGDNRRNKGIGNIAPISAKALFPPPNYLWKTKPLTRVAWNYTSWKVAKKHNLLQQLLSIKWRRRWFWTLKRLPEGARPDPVPTTARGRSRASWTSWRHPIGTKKRFGALRMDLDPEILISGFLDPDFQSPIHILIGPLLLGVPPVNLCWIGKAALIRVG